MKRSRAVLGLVFVAVLLALIGVWKISNFVDGSDVVKRQTDSTASDTGSIREEHQMASAAVQSVPNKAELLSAKKMLVYKLHRGPQATPSPSPNFRFLTIG